MDKFDDDEKRWAVACVKTRGRQDRIRMDMLFDKHHARLLDSTVRGNYKTLCAACVGSMDKDGKRITHHICEGTTAEMVLAFGGTIIDRATEEEIHAAWQDFCKEVYTSGIFRRVVLTWMSEFKSVEYYITENKDRLIRYLEMHYPGEAKDEEQNFVSESDMN